MLELLMERGGGQVEAFLIATYPSRLGPSAVLRVVTAVCAYMQKPHLKVTTLFAVFWTDCGTIQLVAPILCWGA